MLLLHKEKELRVEAEKAIDDYQKKFELYTYRLQSKLK